MIKKNSLIFFVLVFITLIIIYLFNSHINYLTIGDPDHSLILDPYGELKEYFFIWRDYNFGGGYGLVGMGKQISVLLFYVLQKIIPEKLSFLVFIFGLLLFSGDGLYKFILEFILSNECRKEIYYTAIVAGLFYSLNLFSCIITAMDFYLLISYLLTPWILYYSFKYITLKKTKYLIITSFLISLFGIAPNPPTVIISLIIITWTILTFKFINKWSFKELLTKGIKIASLSFLLSFWWILPIFIYKLYFTNQFIKTLHMELFYSGISTLLNVFHLSGYWELFNTRYGMKVFYFSDILWKIRPILIILSALIIFSVFIYYKATNNRKDKIILLSYFILFLFGLLLAQGYHPTSIIKDIYFYLVTHSSFFGTFRNNYKWVAILAFCYSMFIPYAYLGYKNLLNKLTNNQKITKTLPYLTIIFFLLTSSFPVWTGTLFNHYFKGIPNKTYEVSEFLNNQIKNDYGKVMIMPGTWLPYYKWAYYFTNRPIFISFIKDRSALIYRYGGEPPLNWYGKKLVDDILYKGFFELDKSILENFGIRYIIIDKTLDIKLGGGLPTPNIKKIEDYLKKEDFKIIYRNKDYVIYELPNNTFSMKTQNKLDVKQLSSLKHFEDEDTLDYRNIARISHVFFVSEIVSFNQSFLYLFPWNAQQKIKGVTIASCKKLNPTLWTVKINAQRPFMLSFAESYDPLWEARIYKNGQKIKTVKSIPLYSVINGFWIDESGDLEIVIRYKPQDWFEMGLAISALTFIGCIGYLFYDWRRNKTLSGR